MIKPPAHTALLIALTLTACEEVPDIEAPGVCESYGVVETALSAGPVAFELALTSLEVAQACPKREGQQVLGCAIKAEDGSIEIYYQAGDACALYHERCHAANGQFHTKRYLERVEEGDPRAVCPEVGE